MHTQSRWPITEAPQPRHRRTRKLHAGSRVGPYVLEAYAGRGGFATVYRAIDSRTTERVAIKILHRELLRSTPALKRFEREIEALGRLHHPNIVEVVDHGALDGRPYYVMRWLDGESIDRSLVRRGAFSLPEVIEIVGEVAEALEVAHGRGVVHRDIKPSNVMLVDDGGRRSVRLLDFGLAKFFRGETGDNPALTNDMIIGTPSYMAPEQFSGEPVTPQTDVYSMGVMLFEMLTGETPFGEANVVAIQTQHMCAPPPAASERAPVPTGVDDVIRKAMAKKPGDRFAGVRGMLDALAGVSRRPSRVLSPVVPRSLTLGFGVHVAAVLDGDELEDDGFDELDDVLDDARDRCQESGLVIIHDSGTSFLALAADPRADTDQILELALDLSFTATPDIGVSITVNRSTVEQTGDEILGGPLLELAEWVAPLRRGVWAAPAILS